MKAGTEAAVAVHTRAVVCPHTAAAAAKWPWLSQDPSRPTPGHLSAWLWFLVLLFGCVKEETENRKHDPFSDWLTQMLWDKPWRQALDRPQRRKHQRKSDASYSAQTSLPSVLRPTASRGAHTHHCSLFSKRYVFLVLLLFLIEMTLYKFSFETFSVVSSYIAQFRNLSETDFISSLTGKDHIHVCVLTHFCCIGLTQDHCSDADGVNSPSLLRNLNEASHSCVNWTIQKF